MFVLLTKFSKTLQTAFLFSPFSLLDNCTAIAVLQIWQKPTNHKPWNKHHVKTWGRGGNHPKKTHNLFETLLRLLTAGYSASAPQTESITYFPLVRTAKVFVPTDKSGASLGLLS